MNRGQFNECAINGIRDYLAQELALYPYREQYRRAAARGFPIHLYKADVEMGYRCCNWTLYLNPKFMKKVVNLSGELSMAARLDEDFSIRIGRGRRGSLSLEIPLPQQWWGTVSVDDLERGSGLTIPIGKVTKHKDVSLSFDNPLCPHLMVSGQTGSGKSNALKLIAYDLIRQNSPLEAGLLLVDSRKRGKAWKQFESVPHLLNPVAKTETEARKVLSWAVAELDRRSEQDRNTPRIFIAIDETQSLLEGENKDGFALLLKDLVVTGREYGLHTILGLSNPTASVMAGKADLKRNIALRLTGRCDSATMSHVATGLKQVGAESLTGAGDFLLCQPSGTQRLTTALLTERDMDALPYSESGRTLDFGGIEDIDRVVGQVKPGRQQDPLSAQHVAFALLYPKSTQRDLNRRFSIGFAKAKRILTFASELRNELLQLTARQRNNHIVAG